MIAIDRLSFDYTYIDDKTHHDITSPPECGCYIYGLYCEGARWDFDKHMITDPKPKELFSNFPMIYLQPREDRI